MLSIWAPLYIHNIYTRRRIYNIYSSYIIYRYTQIIFFPNWNIVFHIANLLKVCDIKWELGVGGKGNFSLPTSAESLIISFFKETSLYILEKYIGGVGLPEAERMCREWESELMDGWLNEYKWTDTFTGK